ncbi:putative HD domain-containing protein [Acanthamoeba polyphaga mimivirus]|uniref:HD domain-containing protein n=1 Tax=Acanthamoeba polyphaga mimivirus Kroon TaxID=3069720 RepID=A0A0G2Y8J7_9VIRU|nr:putative HD domain-containing protein [Acanthamoeba polyphaga mimivirus]AKI80127.1 putative HD domain-containing protein [Acanthamoeba polyphaga mimivirus Kroon]
MKSCEYSKLFGCNIYGFIRVTSMAQKIIDTSEFQRLRNMKQLGLCYLVFPAATHTRLEHSIGVYDRTRKVIERIYRQYPDREYYIPELSDKPIKLDAKIIECIKIAGLCHDIGHGPFSHVFDDVLLTDIDHPNKHHEIRSCLITEIICRRELSNELNDNHIDFIKSIINPTSSHKGAIYQIVSNNLNGIDVDKFDYLARDSKNLNIGSEFNASRLINEFIIDKNNNIAYPKQCCFDIDEMYNSRYCMHKKVYSHKTVKLLEMMLKDIFTLIDPIFKISETINDMSQFCKLTDNSIFELISTTINPRPFIKINIEPDQFMAIKKANTIYQNILSRKLYKQIMEINENNGGKVLCEKFIDYVTNKHPTIKNSLYLFKTVRGFIGGNKNPFGQIYFYDKMEDDNSFTMPECHFSGLINKGTQEVTWHIYCKDPKILDLARFEVKNFFNTLE